MSPFFYVCREGLVGISDSSGVCLHPSFFLFSGSYLSYFPFFEGGLQTELDAPQSETAHHLSQESWERDHWRIHGGRSPEGGFITLFLLVATVLTRIPAFCSAWWVLGCWLYCSAWAPLLSMSSSSACASTSMSTWSGSKCGCSPTLPSSSCVLLSVIVFSFVSVCSYVRMARYLIGIWRISFRWKKVRYSFVRAGIRSEAPRMRDSKFWIRREDHFGSEMLCYIWLRTDIKYIESEFGDEHRLFRFRSACST